jgi:hypothetical protein
LAVALGLVFFIPRFLTSRPTIFHDLSWMVGLMITAATLFLYYATSTLQNLVMEAEARLPASSRHLYMKPLQSWLSDRKFVIAGAAFGVLNCIMGYSFGLRPSPLPGKITIYFGYFVVGFVSGMAAYGVTGVYGFVHGFVRAEPQLDYQDPDKCGGTSFLGSALVKFSVLNLVMGVMISIYIEFAPWTNHDGKHPAVHVLMWAWIAFPYLVSLAHILGPGAALHALLQSYKTRTQREVAAEVKRIRASLQMQNGNNKALREDLDYQLKLQAELYRMNTWPFSFASIVHFALAFCADVVPAYFEVVKLVNHKGIDGI